MNTPEHGGKENEILAEMVKSRECCRKAARAFEAVRAAADQSAKPQSDTRNLLTADRAVTSMLAHLEKIPAGIRTEIGTDSGREYAARLLAEISDILEKTMILEREIRETTAGRPSPSAMNRRAARTVEAYAN